MAFLLFLLIGPVSAAAAQAGPAGAADSALQNDKLREEIRKLRIENERPDALTLLVNLAPSLAAAAAIATVGVSWSKQREDSRRQRTADREQHEADSVRQFHANFATLVANLGSESPSLQASAASTLAIYLDDRYAEFHENVVRVVIANLKADHSTVVHRLLVGVLGRALTAEGSAATLASLTGPDLELAGAHLRGLQAPDVSFPAGLAVHGADLVEATIDGASLWKANLSGAKLDRISARRANLGQSTLKGATLVNANLDGARMTSASLRRANAQYASFRGAQLQSAHFNDADLRGARFEGANVTDTYFSGARLDTDGLRSLLRTPSWPRAHFDAEVLARLQALNGGP